MAIDRNELKKKAMEAASAEEIMEIMKAAGEEITAEEAKQFFEKVQERKADKALSLDELDAVTGGEERLIPVEWASDGQNTFYATVTIIAYDRVNMLGEIATIIGEHNVSIRAASIQNDDKTRISTLRLTLDVHSREEMDKVMGALRNKSDILDVYR